MRPPAPPIEWDGQATVVHLAAEGAVHFSLLSSRGYVLAEVHPGLSAAFVPGGPGGPPVLLRFALAGGRVPAGVAALLPRQTAALVRRAMHSSRSVAQGDLTFHELVLLAHRWAGHRAAVLAREKSRART